MQRYHVRVSDEAETDIAEIYRFVRRKAASASVARTYVGRIYAFLQEFESFPERGTVRANVRDVCGSSDLSVASVLPSS